MTTQAVTRTQKFQKYTGKLYVKGNGFKVIPSCIDGWDLCATYCLQFQPPCIGFNYDKQTKNCELLDSVTISSSAKDAFTSETWLSGNNFSVK